MRRPNSRLLLLAALKLGAAAYVLLGVVAGYLTAEGFARPHRRARTHPASWVSPTARDIRIEAPDGAFLGATYQPPVAGRPVLVLAHGIGNSREHWLPVARLFTRVGYGSLAFDWRAHGESDGEGGTFGHLEGEDLKAILAWLRTHGDPPLAVLASSMGGGIVAGNVHHLGPQVKALVLDSAYGSLPRMVDHHTEKFGPLRWVARPVIHLHAWLRGVSLNRVANLERLAPRPLLVIHSSPDATVPFEEGQALYDGYSGPKQAFFSRPGRHMDARVREWPRWISTVARFLEQNLPGAPPAAVVVAAAPAEFAGLYQAP